MQRALSILGLLFGILAADAQVNVEVVFEQEQFLRSESLPLRLRISNFSGQTLQLGTEPDWLVFTVEDRAGHSLAKVEKLPQPEPFRVESSKTVALRMDLMPYFDLSNPGRYTITARMRVPQLQKDLVAEPKQFDIVGGTKLWEHEVGIPGTTPPVVRRFALQQAAFLKQLRLYVRVTDASEATVYRVVSLGMLTSFSQPEALVDASSNLHVLFQNGASTFHYSIITPEGEQIVRQTYDFSTRPRLKSESDGRVVVNGGQRRILLSDLPPPRVANTNDTVLAK